MLSTHCRPCSEKCRSAPIAGSATIVIVPSRSTMKNAPQRSASATSGADRGPGAPWAAPGQAIASSASEVISVVAALGSSEPVDDAGPAAREKWAIPGRPVLPPAGVTGNPPAQSAGQYAASP